LWSQTLDVRFAEAVDGTPGDQREIERIIAETDVQIVLADGERVFADRLDVDALDRLAVITGNDVRLVDQNNVIDRAERIVIDENAQMYTLEGKGRFRRFNRPVVPATRDRLAITMFDQVADRTEELRVRWTGGVEIRPVDGVPEGIDPDDLPRIARFRDHVQLVSEKLKLMHADEMSVGFAPDEHGEQNIRTIQASGGVHARAFSRDAETGASREVGAIHCSTLHVAMIVNDGGQPVPDWMEAAGEVHVSNASASARQDLWSETLGVTFRHDGSSEDAGVSDRGTEALDELGGAGTYAHMITATGGVQILLAGGERVFADRLVANAPEQSAQIFGEELLIIGDEFVLNGCKHLELDERSGSYQVHGPGSFYAFAEPATLAKESRAIERPVIDLSRPKQLDATWSESALYASNDERSGTLDLRGDVRAHSQPNDVEFNTISADMLTLDFVDRGESTSTPDAQQLELALLLARGDAKLESRTWRTADHTDTPRVFYIAGQHVRYDTRTREARIVGDGHLLVRDEWADDAPAATKDDRFAGKGTTDFRWKNLLEMTPSGENVYNIVMTGDVECRHLSLDDEATTMSGERLEATLNAQPPEGEPVANESTTSEQAGIVEIGGPVDVTRLAGEGNIFVRTTEHDVACDVFDYDTQTGIAEAAARPGRMVSVLSGEAARPLRAERIVWNMIDDTISVTRGSGAGTP
jgi:hypothetical protein